MEEHIHEIKKMADFQMRKSTHIRFLENCIAEQIIPKGLKLKLKVHVGVNTRLQETVDRILEKTSLEICNLVKEEHSLQLHESKGKMIELENKLRKVTSDEGNFNEVTAEIFTVTEEKKNKIIDRQQKKLQSLLTARYKTKVDAVSNTATVHEHDPNNVNHGKKFNSSVPQKSAKQTYKTKKNQYKKEYKKKNSYIKAKQNNTFKKKQGQSTSNTSDAVILSPTAEKSSTVRTDYSHQPSKNSPTLGTTRKTYSEAVQQGKTHQNQQLQQSINTLITCLQNLQKTEGLFVSKPDGNGNSTRNISMKRKGEKRQ